MNKEGWGIRRFDEVFDLQMGRTPSRDKALYWEDGKHKWVSIADMGTCKYISKTKESISDLAKLESKIKTVPKGTVIMSFKLSIGKVAITTEDMHTNEAIMAFNPINVNTFRTDYIYYYLKGYDWGGSNRAVMGTTLNKASISSSKIITPPLPIQEQIVKELDTLGDIIAKKKEQLAELDTLAQATFYELFGDPVDNEKGWEVKGLGDIGTLGRGMSKHRPRNAPELLGGKYPLVQTGEVANAGLYIKKYTQTYSEIGLKQSKLWNEGTLCITIAANIAKTAILTIDACFPDSIVGFINNEKTNTIFIHYWFSFFQKILEEQAPEVAQKNINLKILNELKVILPPLPLQNQFAERIEAIEKQKELINKSIVDVQLLFDYTMDKYFN